MIFILFFYADVAYKHVTWMFSIVKCLGTLRAQSRIRCLEFRLADSSYLVYSVV